MILINLLPHREAARKRRREVFFISLGVAAVIGGVIAGGIYGWYQVQISNQQDRNALLQKEIKTLEGQIKDIATLQQEIAALRQLIDRAHAAGIRIYGATVTPFEGSPDYTPEGEADRQAVNTFIRSGVFDGILDFDAVLRDPAQPTHLRASAESNGHLHPNDEGYRLMGDSIDLTLFK